MSSYSSFWPKPKFRSVEIFRFPSFFALHFRGKGSICAHQKMDQKNSSLDVAYMEGGIILRQSTRVQRRRERLEPAKNEKKSTFLKFWKGNDSCNIFFKARTCRHIFLRFICGIFIEAHTAKYRYSFWKQRLSVSLSSSFFVFYPACCIWQVVVSSSPSEHCFNTCLHIVLFVKNTAAAHAFPEYPKRRGGKSTLRVPFWTQPNLNSKKKYGNAISERTQDYVLGKMVFPLVGSKSMGVWRRDSPMKDEKSTHAHKSLQKRDSSSVSSSFASNLSI